MDETVQVFLQVFTWPNFLWVIEKFGFISVAASIFVYWFDQRRQRHQEQEEEHNKMKNACSTILTEIDHNMSIYIRQNGYYHSILRDGGISYISANFSSKAHQSLIHSGFYSNFSVDTQRNLLALYDRIEHYNELLHYLNRYYDMHLLFGQEDLYFVNVERYEIDLTARLDEIRQFMAATKALMNRELTSL
jgi:hypothetical protein